MKFLSNFYHKKYFYEKEKYNIRFLEKKIKNPEAITKVNKVIYCFWTGNNPMSENRLKGLKSLQKNSGAEVILVNPSNLDNFIKKDFPLHPAYSYLSLVHKSDYLRCYFMHHFGGGYSDIKPQLYNWEKAFEKLNNDNNVLAIGYHESSYKDIGYITKFVNPIDAKKMNKDLKKNFNLVIGNGGYIFKPYTQFTELWITELHKRLDENFETLKAHPGNIMGDNEGYPLPWTSILGQIFHPLCLMFHEHLLFDENLKPVCKDYR
ncbi:glycosyltransferase family 32 protein [Acinetobacter schindleri]|uniref:capsular polysaccharide synthesis protein n=2 Tax=Bacteria TaxID=2 RepID=UPI00097277A6|nr:capsular polysaccharide synthesis protein [Acinetobacter schindleri]APX61991.1 hypothetical protein AsACE_CH00548 [Acinetobacter schindleri]